MEKDVGRVGGVVPYTYSVKVHQSMCTELSKFVDRISEIFPAIESAQPRASGIEALCTLNAAIEKSKLIAQHCTECSKLYLAITGTAIISRCERVRNALVQSLSNIQSIVPRLLASQISGIVKDLKGAKFIMDSSEEVAMKALLVLVHQGSNSTDASEYEAFQTAALRLGITSPKAILIEKRSIKKLLDKIGTTDQKKNRILNYFLYLLKKYGNLIRVEQMENATLLCEDMSLKTKSTLNGATCMDKSTELEPGFRQDHIKVENDSSSDIVIPDEFICPISQRLMYDPVVIASGQTFERVWIEKWFSEGHDTCPKLQEKLSHLSIIPNSSMKVLILNWCSMNGISIRNPCSGPIPAAILSWKSSSSTHITSLDSSMNDMDAPTQIDLSYTSAGFSDSSWGSDMPHSKIAESLGLSSAPINGINSIFLSELSSLTWESQCKAMGDVKKYLEDNNQACDSLLPDNFVECLVQFLKNACEQCDLEAQRVGTEILLAFVSKNRNGIPFLGEDLFHLLTALLDSKVAGEALEIMQILSGDEYWKSKMVGCGVLPSILNMIGSQVSEFYAPGVKILHNMSLYCDIRLEILEKNCIPKVISLLSDDSLAEYCLKILKYLCGTEEGRIAVAEADGSIPSMTELLETGSLEQQEHALSVLLCLCSHHFEYCLLVMKEGIIPSLVNLSINGNTKGKESSMELLRLLRDIRSNDPQDSSDSSPPSEPELLLESKTRSKEKRSSSSKNSGFFARKFSLFTKSRAVALA